MVSGPDAVSMVTRGILVCGSARNSSAIPSSARTRSVAGWIVSPRKSRRKSPCFSRTVTSTPARASSRPAIIPAGPPPLGKHALLPALLADLRPQVLERRVDLAAHGGQVDAHEPAVVLHHPAVD